MSILISDATGSREIAASIKQRPGHPDVELLSMAEMPFGDCMLAFLGPDRKRMTLGIEIKKLDDLLACIQTGRFAGHQMPGMLDTYDMSMLLVEGIWGMNADNGVLEHLHGRGFGPVSTGPRKWMFRELNRWLLVLSIVAGIQVIKTRSRAETVQTLIDLHELGAEQWNDHKSLRTHSNVTVDQLRYRTMPDGSRRMRFEKPGLVEKLVAQLDGIGVDRAVLVAKHFKTAEELGRHWMDEKVWQAVPDAKIGKGISKSIVRQIRGEKA